MVKALRKLMAKISRKTREETETVEKWTAAEYNYLKEFEEDLQELKTHLNDLKAEKKTLEKAKAALTMVGRAEKRLDRYYNRLKKDIKKLVEILPEHLRQKEIGIEEQIEIAAESLLKQSSRYVGNLKDKLNSLITQFDLLEEYKNKPEKAGITKEINDIANNLIKEINGILEWIAGLVAALKKEEAFTKLVIVFLSNEEKDWASKLDDKDYKVRIEAINNLLRLNSKDSITLIRRKVIDKTHMVGQCAISALVKLKDNGSIPLFRKLLENDKYWLIHGEIIDALAEFGDKKSIPIIKKFLSSKKKYLHSHAVAALGKLGDKSSFSLIESKLSTKDDLFIRMDAIKALKRLGGKQAVVLLRKALKDSYSLNRAIAIEALAKIDFKGNFSYVKKMLLEDKDNREYIIEILSENLKPTRDKKEIMEVIPFIEKIMVTKSEGPDLRKLAMWFVAIKFKSKESRALINKIYKDRNEDGDVARYALQCLRI